MDTQPLLFEDNLSGWKLDVDIPAPISSKYPPPLEEIPHVLTSIQQVGDLFESLAYIRFSEHKQFFFRGHSNSVYKLISSIGRLNLVDYSIEYDIYYNLKAVLQSDVYSHFRLPSFNEELFYYGIGRHLGLICRLLDWTAGFWEALSFSLYDSFNKDGSLWIMMLPNDYPIENRSPFSIQDNDIHILKEDYYYPDDYTRFPLGIQRRSHQHGFFSVVKESWISIPLNDIPVESHLRFFHFTIPKEVKDLLRKDKRIIDVDKWLYIEEKSPILNDIKLLNNRITSMDDNGRR